MRQSLWRTWILSMDNWSIAPILRCFWITGCHPLLAKLKIKNCTLQLFHYQQKKFLSWRPPEKTPHNMFSVWSAEWELNDEESFCRRWYKLIRLLWQQSLSSMYRDCMFPFLHQNSHPYHNCLPGYNGCWNHWKYHYNSYHQKIQRNEDNHQFLLVQHGCVRYDHFIVFALWLVPSLEV